MELEEKEESYEDQEHKVMVRVLVVGTSQRMISLQVEKHALSHPDWFRAEGDILAVQTFWQSWILLLSYTSRRTDLAVESFIVMQSKLYK